MNTVNEKYIGEARMLDKPGKKIGFRIADGSVTTPKLADHAVTPEKLSESTVAYLQGILEKGIEDLQNQVDALEIHGIAVSNEFGSDTHISISQKTMTDAINRLWSKIEEMTGEALQGINMTVTPDFFISEDGADVTITANTVETNGIFESIAFYGNGELIASAENVDTFEHHAHIDETTIIKCVAKIMGVEYTAQHIITHYNSFWLGAGTAYSDIMDESHVIPITNGMRGAYDVTVADGDNTIIVVGDSLKEGFIRADMNGFEIPMTESSVTVDGVAYKVFTSVNTYQFKFRKLVYTV